MPTTRSVCPRCHPYTRQVITPRGIPNAAAAFGSPRATERIKRGGVIHPKPLKNKGRRMGLKDLENMGLPLESVVIGPVIQPKPKEGK